MITGHPATLSCIIGFVEKLKKNFIESKRNDMPEERSGIVFDELVRNTLMSTLIPIISKNKIFEPIEEYKSYNNLW